MADGGNAIGHLGLGTRGDPRPRNRGRLDAAGPWGDGILTVPGCYAGASKRVNGEGKAAGGEQPLGRATGEGAPGEAD